MEDILITLAVTSFGGGVAACMGLGVHQIHTRMLHKKEIEKIKTLFNDEFKRIYNVLMTDKETFGCLQQDNIRIYNNKVSNITMNIIFRGDSSKYFTLVWDAVISSGNLIKLDHNDIKILQEIKNDLDQHNEYMKALLNEIKPSYEAFTDQESNSVDKEQFERRSREYFKNCKETTNDILDIFEETSKLTWVNMKEIKKRKPITCDELFDH